MAVEEEWLRKIESDISEMRELLMLNAQLLAKYETILEVQIKTKEELQYIVGGLAWLVKPDFVCADPHGWWDGHLPGAYSEGDQVKTTLLSKNHKVTMKRHPVTKDEFLSNLGGKYIAHLAGHGGVSGGQVKFCFDDGDVYPADISALTSVPSRLFFAGVCFGGYNNTMANAFRGKGTDYYVGFTQSIPDWDAKYFDDLVYEKWLIDGKDLRTALDEADDSYPALSCWVLWE